MDTIIKILTSQGPLGIMAGLFLYLFLHERTKNTKLQKEISQIYNANYATLDKIREGQIRREQEVGETLKEYGKGVIEAVQHTTIVAEELRRLHVRR